MNHRVLILNFTVPKQISRKIRVANVDVTVSKHKSANSMITTIEISCSVQRQPIYRYCSICYLTRVIIYSPPQDNQYKCKGLVSQKFHNVQLKTSAYDFYQFEDYFHFIFENCI